MKKLSLTLLILLLCSQSVSALYIGPAETEQIRERFKNFDAEDPENQTFLGPENCEALNREYNNEAGGFIVFLTDAFKNKASSTSLTNNAIAKYNEVRGRIDEMYDLYESHYLSENRSRGDTGEQLAGKLAICQELRDVYKERLKSAMLQHIKITSGQKKSTILVEKYKAINQKLRDMNFAVSQMYGLFKTFAGKVPFFPTRVMQK